MKEIMLQECVSHVHDGEEAMDFLLCRGIYTGTEKPQTRLVILDLRLPKADGIDVLRAIRSEQSLKRLPVVIMSSSESPSDIKAAYSCAANGYVVKPMDFDDFKRTVSAIAFFWLKHNKTADGLV